MSAATLFGRNPVNLAINTFCLISTNLPNMMKNHKLALELGPKSPCVAAEGEAPRWQKSPPAVLLLSFTLCCFFAARPWPIFPSDAAVRQHLSFVPRLKKGSQDFIRREKVPWDLLYTVCVDHSFMWVLWIFRRTVYNEAILNVWLRLCCSCIPSWLYSWREKSGFPLTLGFPHTALCQHWLSCECLSLRDLLPIDLFFLLPPAPRE